MVSALEQLRALSTVVADTGDLAAVAALRPVDCTTNPSLVLKAVQAEAFAGDFRDELATARRSGAAPGAVARALTLRLGARLAGLVPGRVSTEVDARLSFDAEASVAAALDLVRGYQDLGIGSGRILIKLAATWEGIAAARRLEAQGINCNLTLVFCGAQARAAADAGAFLISPFVGRITDWHRARGAQDGRSFAAADDPGVLSVRDIYRDFKGCGVATIVMAASFRSTAQVRALAGCDRLTLSPDLLEQLAQDTDPLTAALQDTGSQAPRWPPLTEAAFRWQLNADAMATEKLAEGLRGFAADGQRLLDLIGVELARG